MENKHKKTEQTDGLTPKERYDAKKRDKERTKQTQYIKKEVTKKSKSVLIIAIIIAVIGGGIFWLGAKISSIPYLPTTSPQNHSETAPVSHILTTSMSDREQAHMLEHSDGDGFPGIIIQYNCNDYECAPDLLEQLTKIVEEYPDNVYLAPNNYDGKIILTKAGRLETLESFDEEKIRKFIGN